MCWWALGAFEGAVLEWRACDSLRDGVPGSTTGMFMAGSVGRRGATPVVYPALSLPVYSAKQVEYSYLT